MCSAKKHDNTNPDFKTELFGNWKPINGKIDRWEILQYSFSAEVIFKKSHKENKGAICFTGGNQCDSNGFFYLYEYRDADYASYYRGYDRSYDHSKTSGCKDSLLDQFYSMWRSRL